MNFAHKWEDVADQLLPDENMVKVIEKDHPNDAVKCCKCVLDKWFETKDATLNQLISALKSPSVQLDSFADQLEQQLITRRKLWNANLL